MASNPRKAASSAEAAKIAAYAQTVHHDLGGTPAPGEKSPAEEPVLHRDSEHVLRTFINNSPSVIFLKDTKGRYVLINEQFEKRFQLTAQQVIGCSDPEIFAPEQAAQFQANDQRVLSTGI